MPHSNDSTIVTCAGDGEVRVFDIERAAATGSASSVRGARFDNRYKGVKYYTQNNTNGRVYRSHGDRVKRIVTESSPHLFLSCSEDGEVRQFDLRLPSSAYPAPSGSRSFGLSTDSGARVPPPLISYKKYRLDLNTISCSGSQPHYIALGGAHLHCLLHDRRMLGRDLSEEKGQPGRASPASELSSNEEDAMGQATRCVRKFAPKGQRSARKAHNPHITACKISDENPNEMIVSWSGDHVYSFNLIRDNAQSREPENVKSSGKPKRNGEKDDDNNHKRKKTDSTTSLEDKESKRAKARLRRREVSSLQIQYENGESEDLHLDDLATQNPSLPPRPQVWFDSQRRSTLIARSLTRLRKLMFSLDDHTSTSSGADQRTQIPAKTSFERAHELVKAILPEMNQICRVWRYPVDPTDEEAGLQRTLRANRDAARSFVQSAGTLAKFLHLHDSPGVEDEDTTLDQIRSPPSRGPLLLPDHTFSLEFLKAIHLWLKGGRMALLQGFKVIPSQPRTFNFPIPASSGEGGLDDHLIPYLIQLASDRSISNVEASRFEKDETRKLFNSETAAVIAFSNAIRMPLEDLSRAVLPANQGPHESRTLPEAQDRRTATIFWGRKVARGVLLNAGEGLNYEVVSIAFGGLGNIEDQEAVEESREQEDIDTDAMEEVVQSIRVNGHNSSDGSSRSESEHEDEPVVMMEEDVDEDVTGPLLGAFVEEEEDQDAEDNEDPGQENDGDDDDDDDEAEDDEDAEDGVYSFLSRSSAARGQLHSAVEPDIPCYSHIREYRGHCNVKTVKDANFFGLRDEYVVSGSDSGHLFIWDKDTGEVVNILEGDSQVVNVVQGKLDLSLPNGVVLHTRCFYFVTHVMPTSNSLAITSHLFLPLPLSLPFSSPTNSNLLYIQATPTNPSSPYPASTAPSKSSPLTLAPKKPPSTQKSSSSNNKTSTTHPLPPPPPSTTTPHPHQPAISLTMTTDPTLYPLAVECRIAIVS